MRQRDLPTLVLHYQQTPLRKLSDKATQTRFSSSWLCLSELLFIPLFSFYDGRPIFGLSFDILYTFLLPDAPLWYAVCVPPLCWVTQWAAFFSCSSLLHPHTQIYMYTSCQPQSPFSWWRLLASGGEKPPHDSRTGALQETTFSVQGGT